MLKSNCETKIEEFNKKAIKNEPDYNYDIIVAVDIYGKVFIIWHDEKNCHPDFTPTKINKYRIEKSLKPGIYSVKYAIDSYKYTRLNIEIFKKLWSLND